MTWPLNDSAAAGDLILIKTCSCCVNQVVLVPTSLHLNEKCIDFFNKVRSLPASLAFIGQVTKHTSVMTML